MRRNDGEITTRREIDRVIQRAQVCRIAFISEGEPYLVPVCFGYDGSALYFHCAVEGRKLGMLAPGAAVCFEMETDVGVVPAPGACGWTMTYSSVIGWGRAAKIGDEAEKVRALDTIMAHYGGPAGPYDPGPAARTILVRIDIERLTGKRNSEPARSDRTGPGN